jgi:hypothetical protein
LIVGQELGQRGFLVSRFAGDRVDARVVVARLGRGVATLGILTQLFGD